MALILPGSSVIDIVSSPLCRWQTTSWKEWTMCSPDHSQSTGQPKRACRRGWLQGLRAPNRTLHALWRQKEVWQGLSALLSWNHYVSTTPVLIFFVVGYYFSNTLFVALAPARQRHLNHRCLLCPPSAPGHWQAESQSSVFEIIETRWILLSV